jgi:hypothetical protein
LGEKRSLSRRSHLGKGGQSIFVKYIEATSRHANTVRFSVCRKAKSVHEVLLCLHPAIRDRSGKILYRFYRRP